MSRFLLIVLLGILSVLPSVTRADDWRVFSGVKILTMTQWQDNGPIYIMLAPEQWCYVPPTEKNLIAQVLTMYAAGRVATYHCSAEMETMGGIPGSRLHRVVGT